MKTTHQVLCTIFNIATICWPVLQPYSIWHQRQYALCFIFLYSRQQAVVLKIICLCVASAWWLCNTPLQGLLVRKGHLLGSTALSFPMLGTVSMCQFFWETGPMCPTTYVPMSKKTTATHRLIGWVWEKIGSNSRLPDWCASLCRNSRSVLVSFEGKLEHVHMEAAILGNTRVSTGCACVMLWLLGVREVHKWTFSYLICTYCAWVLAQVP